MSDVEFKDNSGEILAALDAAIYRALEKCGLAAEGYAKKLCPVDTGNLRNSITHLLGGDRGDAKVVYVGTNSEYAAYVELGTGIYTDGGRPTPWAYQDARGEWHWTRGNKAQPYLKPAVTRHKPEYNKILENELKSTEV